MKDKKINKIIISLLILIALSVIFAINGVCQLDITKRTVTIDSLSQRQDTLWFTDGNGSVVYIRNSGDSLYFWDTEGEKALSDIALKSDISDSISDIPTSNIDLSSVSNNSLLFELNDTMGYSDSLYYHNNHLHVGVQDLDTGVNLIKGEGCSGIIIENGEGNGLVINGNAGNELIINSSNSGVAINATLNNASGIILSGTPSPNGFIKATTAGLVNALLVDDDAISTSLPITISNKLIVADSADLGNKYKVGNVWQTDSTHTFNNVMTIKWNSDTITASQTNSGDSITLYNGNNTILSDLIVSYNYNTTAYTIGSTDTVFIYTKVNGENLKVAAISDDMFEIEYSAKSYFPISVQQTSGQIYWMVIPSSKFSLGDSGWKIYYELKTLL